MNRYRFLGILVYYIAWVLNKTLRVKVVVPWDFKRDKQYLCAFWHGKQFLAALSLLEIHDPNQAVLVSASKDGDIVSSWLEKWGYKVVRGSSRRDAVKGSMAIMRVLKEGYSFGFAIDGPMGPIHKVKPGASYMAQKLQLGIIPVGSACNRKWIFSKAWDKFELPKPFSKAVVYVGEPLQVPEDADLIKINAMLEQRITEAENKAKQLLDQ